MWWRRCLWLVRWFDEADGGGRDCESCVSVGASVYHEGGCAVECKILETGTQEWG